MNDEAQVRLTFVVEISSNRYVTDALSPAMLQVVADRVMQDDEVQDTVNAAVEKWLEYFHPESVRKTNEDGESLVKVTMEFEYLPLHTQDVATYYVWTTDLASAHEIAFAQWKEHSAEITVRYSKLVKSDAEWVNNDN